MASYYQKNKIKILEKLKAIREANFEYTSSASLCFPDRVYNSNKYKKFLIQYRLEFPYGGSKCPKERRAELLKEFGITPSSVVCNESCPYKKECQRENKKMREGMHAKDDGPVFMPYNELEYYD